MAFSDDGGWLATVSLNVQCLTLKKLIQNTELRPFRLDVLFFFSFQPGWEKRWQEKCLGTKTQILGI